MKIFWITFIIWLLSISVSAQNDSTDYWISQLDNSCIVGTCHYALVVEPRDSNGPIYRLAGYGKLIQDRLFSLLTHPDKGVAAHYVLSLIYGKWNCATLSIEQLEPNNGDLVTVRHVVNGLVFTEIDGRMHATKKDLEKCTSYWSRIRDQEIGK